MGVDFMFIGIGIRVRDIVIRGVVIVIDNCVDRVIVDVIVCVVGCVIVNVSVIVGVTECCRAVAPGIGSVINVAIVNV